MVAVSAGWLVALVAFALLVAVPPAPAGARLAGTGLTAGVDDWVHIWEAVQLVNVRQALPDPPTGPVVYYLGDSIARESTVSDEGWTRQLNRRAASAGRRADAVVFTVAGHNQTFGMDETIIDALPTTPPGQPSGIVLIGVGISRFIGPPTTQSPAHVDSPPAGGLPVLSRWVRHHYDDRALLSVARKRELVPRWMDRRWAGFKRNRTANLRTISNVIAACKARNLRPVLFDLPLNLAIIGSGLDAPRSSIHSGCSALARKHGITYLRLQPSLKLRNTAFWDIHHLVRLGYTAWQTRLSNELVRMLPKN